jgi:hypothetical protein
LFTAGLAGPNQLQVFHFAFEIESHFLGEAEVDDVFNSQDRDGAFCDVGGDDDLVPPSGLLEQFPSDVIVEDGRVDIYDLELFVQTFSVKKLDNEVAQVLNLGQTGHEDQN